MGISRKKKVQRQTKSEKAQAGLGDMEYSVPYLKALEHDPIARLGFDPERIRYGVPLTGQFGEYYGSGSAEEIHRPSNFKVLKESQVSDQPLNQDDILISTIGYPEDIDRRTVLHEARHRGFNKLNYDEQEKENLRLDVRNPELKSKLLDANINAEYGKGRADYWRNYYDVYYSGRRNPIDEAEKKLQRLGRPDPVQEEIEWIDRFLEMYNNWRD